jgi:hypothetical protein
MQQVDTADFRRLLKYLGLVMKGSSGKGSHEKWNMPADQPQLLMPVILPNKKILTLTVLKSNLRNVALTPDEAAEFIRTGKIGRIEVLRNPDKPKR